MRGMPSSTWTCRAVPSRWSASSTQSTRRWPAAGGVYVHCWGGIGRTGTTVGCWFVRHGRTGDQALAEIAERWQWMEKAIRFPAPRPRRPSSATTSADGPSLAARRRRVSEAARRDRFRGCLLGAGGGRRAGHDAGVPARRARSSRSTTCWAGGRSACGRASGPTTPRLAPVPGCEPDRMRQVRRCRPDAAPLRALAARGLPVLHRVLLQHRQTR